MSFDDVLKLMSDTHKAKNSDYGNSFRLSAQLLNRPIIEGLLHRMSDKLSRVCQITQKGGAAVKSESVQDTLLDLSVYSILAYLTIEREKNV